MTDTHWILLVGVAAVFWFMIILRLRFRHYVLFAVPVLNVVADMMVDQPLLGPLHFGHVRAVVLVLVFLFFFNRMKIDAVLVTFVGLCAYLFALLSYATDLYVSGYGVVRPVVALLMFPVGCVAVKNLVQFRALNIGVALAVGILLVNFVVAQIFKLGRSVYIEDGTYLGEAGISIAYMFAYALLIAPLAWEQFKIRRFHSMVAAMTGLIGVAIAMVLVFRRGAILGFVAGLFVYVVMAPRGKVRRLAFGGAVAGTIMFLAYPLFAPRLEILVRTRGDVVEYVQNTDVGRMAEFGYVTKDFLDGSLRHKLIGSEPFNSRLYYSRTRPLHVDYMSLLNGTGIIGLLWYLSVFAVMAMAIWRAADRIGGATVRHIRAVAFALIVGNLTMSFSSQMYMVTPMATFFLYMGAILGLLRSATGGDNLRPVLRGGTWSTRTGGRRIHISTRDLIPSDGRFSR